MKFVFLIITHKTFIIRYLLFPIIIIIWNNKKFDNIIHFFKERFQ